MFEVCAYLDGKLMDTVQRDNFQAAELQALDFWRQDPSAQVTIYGKNGNARRGWYMRGRHNA